MLSQLFAANMFKNTFTVIVTGWVNIFFFQKVDRVVLYYSSTYVILFWNLVQIIKKSLTFDSINNDIYFIFAGLEKSWRMFIVNNKLCCLIKDIIEDIFFFSTWFLSLYFSQLGYRSLFLSNRPGDVILTSKTPLTS